MSAPHAPSPEVALAAQYDASGQHQAALDALARGAQAGDPEAMTQLGKRLLIGDRAPAIPGQGARFLIDAANAGGAEATERLAVLAAAGAYVQQSWREALILLVAAAERGWEPAQSQLRALSTDRRLAAVRDVGSDYWQHLGRSIDLAMWLSAPAGRSLNSDPVVRIFPGLVPDPVCDWLIGQSRGRLVRARVYDAQGGKEVVSETRSNTTATFNLNEIGLVQLLVQARMSAACGKPLQNMEAAAILHYDVGEQITDHYDFVDPRSATYEQQLATNGQRVITFLAYLNDDYEGGETVFPRLGLRHKGRRGEGLLFVNAGPDNQPDLRMLHAGAPPTRGEKWIVSQFVRSRRFLGI